MTVPKLLKEELEALMQVLLLVERTKPIAQAEHKEAFWLMQAVHGNAHAMQTLLSLKKKPSKQEVHALELVKEQVAHWLLLSQGVQ